ncbi:LOW QUALITY PROTEIN: hypothetical protein OSB04_004061 [Centaurea solstitialis]|uniref:PWWP domain-containing protein n=1 Tax=Centaurea solstitialis TaxID=347529 RepID=A0AA38TW36_9ASTR|nr:LOW QUALITY PROTEIN: hypothetical protein OSB04_004061 [Centaurea solstitialis]
MESLKTPETLAEGLVGSRQDGLGFEGKMFDFGGEKCAESGGIDPTSLPVSNPVASVTEIGCRVGSSSHVDVPIKGISLFVELTGGVTSDVSHHLWIVFRNKSDTDSLVDGNRICHQECRPDVGDFVWAMIKNQSWWPGVVCDPKEALKVPRPEDGLLVRCFGNASYMPSVQVKPFVACFEQFSKQNNSKSFVGALEKAVAEFGYRIKTEFTCSCFSKTMAVDGKGDVGDLSATRFQPETFVDYIKDLARDVSKSTKIDCAVNQNFLSAFHRSLGRCQMELRQLEPESVKTETGFFSGGANTDNKDVSFTIRDDIKVERSEKHYEMRERRKSRFLSYPGEPVTEELRSDVNGGVELNNVNVQPVKKPRKKWCRKTVKKDGLVPNVGSFELLSELHSTAQDCLFPIESSKFDSVERFIAGFRKWAFNDFTKEMTIDRTSGQENGIGTGRTIDLNTNTNTTVDTGGKGTRGRPKKVRKKNDNKPVSPLVSGTNSNRGSLIIDFQNVAMANTKTEVLAEQAVRNDEVKEPFSNPIGQCTFLNFGNLPVNQRPPPCKLTPKRRKNTVASETPIHILPNVNGQINPFLIHNLPQINNLDGFNQPNVYPTVFYRNQLTPPCSTGNQLTPPCSIGNHHEPLGVTHEPKKRGRKRKAVDLQANPVRL